MIEILEELPKGVVGFRLDGRLVAEDYTETMLPVVEEAAKAGKVRLVLVIERFDGMAPGAVWQDLKLGVEHLGSWERVAVVSDLEWMMHLMALFGWMTPGDLQHFPMAERTAAIAWAASGDESI